MIELFQNKRFISASGLPLTWKIECDAFTPAMWDWAASRTLAFGVPQRVIGVPKGGLPFALALQPYCLELDEKRHRWVIPQTWVVDDVWTTGGSMTRTMKEHDLWDSGRPKAGVFGLVVFAREPLPAWCVALWNWGL